MLVRWPEEDWQSTEHTELAPLPPALLKLQEQLRRSKGTTIAKRPAAAGSKLPRKAPGDSETGNDSEDAADGSHVGDHTTGIPGTGNLPGKPNPEKN